MATREKLSLRIFISSARGYKENQFPKQRVRELAAWKSSLPALPRGRKNVMHNKTETAGLGRLARV